MVMSNDDDINYEGPPKDWTPLPAVQPNIPNRLRILSEGDYSSYDTLERNLGFLIAESSNIITSAENELRNYNLLIEPETNLERAQQAEWSEELGDVRNYVSYSEYRTMGYRSSRGSNYIRKQYNNAVRGPWGTPASDVAQYLTSVRDEAQRIMGFLDSYISRGSNDQSQNRAIELFHDWTLQALENTGQVGHIFAAQTQRQERYTQSELDQTTPAQARQYQAILQVQLNQAAHSIDELREDLDKHLGANAELFYDSYLGPAIRFRRQISSAIGSPDSSNQLLRDMYQASAVLDDNTQSMLSDMMKRNEIFREKSEKLVARLAESDIRRKTIQDLAVKGSMPANPFTANTTDTLADQLFEIEYEGWINEFEEMATPTYQNDIYATTDSNRFESSHSALADRYIDEAHPQYLLRDGGRIIGDIFALDGVKIDGVDLSDHAHTGEDGSAKISGFSISPGTLPTTVFDGASPDGITNFQLLNYTTVVGTAGELQYEANFEWTGPDGQQFELQVTRVT